MCFDRIQTVTVIIHTIFVCHYFYTQKRPFHLRRTLNNNNLTTLPSGMFSDLYRLRNIRLSDNKFWCDCKLEWLYQQWLPRIPRLGSSTHCHGPANMAGLPLADMHKHHMQCGEHTPPPFHLPPSRVGEV